MSFSTLCCLLRNVLKLHACQHGNWPGFLLTPCRTLLNAHLPKVSGQNLIRALLLSKTVYRKKKKGFDFFNIYVVFVFLYPALLCLN